MFYEVLYSQLARKGPISSRIKGDCPHFNSFLYLHHRSDLRIVLGIKKKDSYFLGLQND